MDSRPSPSVALHPPSKMVSTCRLDHAVRLGRSVPISRHRSQNGALPSALFYILLLFRILAAHTEVPVLYTSRGCSRSLDQLSCVPAPPSSSHKHISSRLLIPLPQLALRLEQGIPPTAIFGSHTMRHFGPLRHRYGLARPS